MANRWFFHLLHAKSLLDGVKIVEISVQTDVGHKRNTNQDYAGIFNNEMKAPLVVLADGMGGHQAGDIASQIAVQYIGENWQNNKITTEKATKNWLIEKSQEANEKIFQKGQSHSKYLGMGTTLVGAFLLDHSFILANIGDSRAYLIREKEICQLTEDHSLVNELVKSGEITKEMAINHPRKNILVRSLGMPGKIEVDIANHKWQSNDYLLLCSDGLTNMISEEEILKIIQSNQTLDEITNQLIASANEAGGLDNITVLLVHFN